MQTLMASIGVRFLHLHGGPLDGERWEVLRDEPKRWPDALVWEADSRPGITETIYYELVETEQGPYYRYAGVTGGA